MSEISVVNHVLDSNNEIIRSGTKILCQVLINGVEEMMYLEESLFKSDSVETKENSDIALSEKLEWGDSDTKLLLDLYHQGLQLIGPLKKFKNKKCLWIHISKEIEKNLGLLRTATQCESRFKTIMKRKTAATIRNHTSGETRVDVPYEDEIDKIKAQDDSLEPEVLISSDQIKINVKESRHEGKKCTLVSKKRKLDLVSVLEHIHQQKEEARERRHREKIEVLKEIFKENTKG